MTNSIIMPGQSDVSKSTGLVDANGKLLNNLSRNAKGGTELLQDRLYEAFPAEFMDQFQIWFSRYRPEEVDHSKTQIFYAHDLVRDPEADKAMDKGGWARFHQIIFVSNWQAQQYWAAYNIPPSRTKVLLNSIEPIESKPRDNSTIKFGYWSTPHRGLEILVPVFERIAAEHDNVTLDVFSSFELYGWPERDDPYKELFARCKAHPKINYHGAVSNDKVREFASTAHVFAYPSIWQETSCLSMMEAMSAGMMCIHPNLGALYETGAGWTEQYGFQEDVNQHAAHSYHILKSAAALDWDNPIIKNKLQAQKQFADVSYNWNTRKLEWKMLLQDLAKQTLRQTA